MKLATNCQDLEAIYLSSRSMSSEDLIDEESTDSIDISRMDKQLAWLDNAAKQLQIFNQQIDELAEQTRQMYSDVNELNRRFCLPESENKKALKRHYRTVIVPVVIRTRVKLAKSA